MLKMIECPDQRIIIPGVNDGSLEMKTLVVKEIPYIIFRRPEQKVFLPSYLNDPAFIHQAYAMPQLKCFLYVMRNQDNSLILQFIQPHEVFLYAGPGNRVEGPERL